MAFKSFSCPNCGANYNPAKYQCEYCGSYIFMTNDNYSDFSAIEIVLPTESRCENGKYPGIYVYGRLLGKDERPISLGAANYFTGLTSAGGKLLLTNKSLSFSAHTFNVGRQESRIELSSITDVKVVANLLVSQQIVVTANGQSHKFVVYHGNEWVKNIKDAMSKIDTPVIPASKQYTEKADYIEELQQLKQLLDMGVITEEEFNIKKRMLLGI